MTPYIEKYNPKHICMAGGVVLNSVMIGKMYDWYPNVEQIYICPVPYDGGLAIGAAQYVYHQILREPRVEWKDNCPAYLGTPYSKEEVNEAIKLNEDKIEVSYTTDDFVIELFTWYSYSAVFDGSTMKTYVDGQLIDSLN